MSVKKKNNALDLGYVPPQAVDIEKAVLGTVISIDSTLPIVASILKADHFYKEEHKVIYKSVLDLYTKSESVDIFTVKQNLKSKNELENIGGAYYLDTLTSSVVGGAHVERHSMIIFEQWMKREMIRVGSDMVKRGYEDSENVFEMLENAEDDLFKVNTEVSGGDAEHIADVLVNVVKDVNEAFANKSTITGVPSGIQGLDRVTGGFQKTDLIILAARPGMGKTALAIDAAKSAAKLGYPAGILSLEMSSKQLAARMVAAESGITNENLKKGSMIDGDFLLMNQAVGLLESLPIYIDDDSALNLFEVRAKARKLVSKHKIKILFIDYVQLMSGSGNNREEVISTISRGLKALAKDLEIPIVAVGQLNRSVETRTGDKKPMLSDLRESGSLEQDADMVIFMWRPEYYNIEYTDKSSGAPVPDGYTEIILAKHRHGRLGVVPAIFIMKYSKFEDYDKYLFNSKTI